MEQIKKRIANLLCIKSIVTICVTVVFSVMALYGKINAESVKDIVWIVIAFYFGTQTEKKAVN
jgi:hypothetical protein